MARGRMYSALTPWGDRGFEDPWTARNAETSAASQLGNQSFQQQLMLAAKAREEQQKQQADANRWRELDIEARERMANTALAHQRQMTQEERAADAAKIKASNDAILSFANQQNSGAPQSNPFQEMLKIAQSRQSPAPQSDPFADVPMMGAGSGPVSALPTTGAGGFDAAAMPPPQPQAPAAPKAPGWQEMLPALLQSMQGGGSRYQAIPGPGGYMQLAQTGGGGGGMSPEAMLALLERYAPSEYEQAQRDEKRGLLKEERDYLRTKRQREDDDYARLQRNRAREEELAVLGHSDALKDVGSARRQGALKTGIGILESMGQEEGARGSQAELLGLQGGDPGVVGMIRRGISKPKTEWLRENVDPLVAKAEEALTAEGSRIDEVLTSRYSPVQISPDADWRQDEAGAYEQAVSEVFAQAAEKQMELSVIRDHLLRKLNISGPRKSSLSQAGRRRAQDIINQLYQRYRPTQLLMDKQIKGQEPNPRVR